MNTIKKEEDVSIGKIHTYLGNFGILVRAYVYILSHGKLGLKDIATKAVLNANYLKAKLIVGDKSDNIPQVFERVGWKKAWSLMSDVETLKEKLKDSKAINRLKLNSKLIDCKYIPSGIQKDIINSYIQTKS